MRLSNGFVIDKEKTFGEAVYLEIDITLWKL